MKNFDFAVRTDRDRRLERIDGINTELVMIHLAQHTSEVVKRRYDVIFTPGNSFGHMTGGFDLGVVHVFGNRIQEAVMDMIVDRYNGMMPVGAAEVVVVDEKAVVYVPTMMVPTKFTGHVDPYMLMHQGLRALDVHVKEASATYDRVLCPLFSAGTGGCDPEIALYQQHLALSEFMKAKQGVFLGCNHLFKDGMSRYTSLLRGRSDA